MDAAPGAGRQPALSGRQKRYLRGLGHALRATVSVGKGGVGPAVVEGLEAQLAANELVKVRFLESFEPGAGVGAERLAAACGAAVAGRVGRTALLYRPAAERPRIQLPEPSGDAGG